MEPVVAAAASETRYGLSGVRLPPAVPSRVGCALPITETAARRYG